MQTNTRAPAFTLSLLLLGCGEAAPSAQISGTIYDETTLKPLAGVEVELRGVQATTDADGHYELNTVAGMHRMTMRRGNVSVHKHCAVQDPEKSTTPDRQVQDAVFPASAESGGPDEILVAYQHNVTQWPSDEAAESGVLVTDRLGNNGHFIDVGERWVIAPRWLPDDDALVFGVPFLGAGTEQDPTVGVFRHDLASGETEHVWRGPDRGVVVEDLSVSEDGQSILVASTYKLHLVRGLGGANETFTLADHFGRADSKAPRGSFGAAGHAYVSALSGSSTETEPVLGLYAVDTLEQDPTLTRLVSEPGKALSAPVTLPDGRVVYTASGRVAAADGNVHVEVETRIYQPTTGSATLPGTAGIRGNPLALKGDALYYEGTHGVHVRHLDSGLELMLFNGAHSVDFRSTQ
jgi:hypothetical protein